MSEEARTAAAAAEAADRYKLEKEAPIRGLAKYVFVFWGGFCTTFVLSLPMASFRIFLKLLSACNMRS